MTPDETISRLVATEPSIQLAFLLLGVGMFCWTVRMLRIKLTALDNNLDDCQLSRARNAVLAPKLRGLFTSALLALLGLFLLMATAQIIPLTLVPTLFAISMWVGLPFVIFIWFQGAPNFVWTWIFGNERWHTQPPPLVRMAPWDAEKQAKKNPTSLNWQLRIICAAAVLCLVGLAYNANEALKWKRRGVETLGTITDIEGVSATHPVKGRGAPIQTVHYRFTASDGKQYAAQDHIWWGDRQLRIGGNTVVYYDPSNPQISLPKAAFRSLVVWIGMFAVWGLIFLSGIAFFWPLWSIGARRANQSVIKWLIRPGIAGPTFG